MWWGLLKWHLEGGIGPDEVGQVLAAEGGCSGAGQAGGDLISHSRQELLRMSPSQVRAWRSSAHIFEKAHHRSATGHTHS